MNRQLTALFAAFEAALVAAIGIAIPLVPLTLLWAVQFGLAIDWAAFWRASVDIWLVGHGVDVTVTLDPSTAARFGLPGAGDPFTITIALLGFALLTVLLAVRAGRRIAETPHRFLGTAVSLVTFAAISFIVTFSSLHPLARPSIVQGTILPTLVFALGMAIGIRATTRGVDAAGETYLGIVGQFSPTVRLIAATALRGGAAAAFAILTAAALVTAGAILASYARIITLYESLHTDVLGGIAVTLGQLALLPNLIIWAASWLVGPGFALGIGSSVGPLGTQLGPLPAVPLLGVLPVGQLSFGFVGLLAPVICGFVIGVLVAPRVRVLSRGQVIATAIAIGLVAGSTLGALAWASSGAAGPGRLADVGPNPWAVVGWGSLEVALSALIGLAVSLRRSRGSDSRGQNAVHDRSGT